MFFCRSGHFLTPFNPWGTKRFLVPEAFNRISACKSPQTHWKAPLCRGAHASLFFTIYPTGSTHDTKVRG
jgi:hypothetical protein